MSTSHLRLVVAFLVFLAALCQAAGAAPQYNPAATDPNSKPASPTVYLWPDAATATDERDKPHLVPYLLADGQEHPLVVVCPGGGYGMLADHEGGPIAQMLNAAGFHAAVLMYRVAPRHRHPAMLNDAQRAVRLVRSRAADWRVASGPSGPKVAILGFSAGGHLTSTLATHFNEFTSPQDDLAGRFSARPDAVVLCYAVIDLSGQHAHTGSRDGLLGPKPDPALVEKLSNHKAVTKQTPPTFLWHTADDPVVPVQNAMLFATACRENGVPVELHIYESSPHGVGLAPGNPDVATWADPCVRFLRRHLAPKAGPATQSRR